jgi:hypothetical protein
MSKAGCSDWQCLISSRTTQITGLGKERKGKKFFLLLYRPQGASLRGTGKVVGGLVGRTSWEEKENQMSVCAKEESPLDPQ